MSRNNKKPGNTYSVWSFISSILGFIMIICTIIFIMYSSNAKEYEFVYKYEQLIGEANVVEEVSRCVSFNSDKTNIEKIKVKFLAAQKVKNGELNIKEGCAKSDNAFGEPSSKRLRYYEYL